MFAVTMVLFISGVTGKWVHVSDGKEEQLDQRNFIYNGFQSGVPKFVPSEELDEIVKRNAVVKDGCTLDYNGCGGEGTPKALLKLVPYQKTLMKACNKHDVCYGCGSKYHWNQKVCDDAFLRDEIALCNKKIQWILETSFSPLLQSSCKNILPWSPQDGAHIQAG